MAPFRKEQQMGSRWRKMQVWGGSAMLFTMSVSDSLPPYSSCVNNTGLVWSLTPVVPACVEMRQESHLSPEIGVNLGHITRQPLPRFLEKLIVSDHANEIFLVLLKQCQLRRLSDVSATSFTK